MYFHGCEKSKELKPGFWAYNNISSRPLSSKNKESNGVHVIRPQFRSRCESKLLNFSVLVRKFNSFLRIRNKATNVTAPLTNVNDHHLIKKLIEICQKTWYLYMVITEIK